MLPRTFHSSDSFTARNQSTLSPELQIDGTGYRHPRTTRLSPRFRHRCSFPSKLAYGSTRALSGTRIVSTTESGSTSGRNDSVCGQMGTNSTPLTPGCTMLPPAASEYAVDPVGVEIMTPSASTFVIGFPSMLTSRSISVLFAPRSMTTSFRTMCRRRSSEPSALTTCATSRERSVKTKSPLTTSSTTRGMDSRENDVRNPSEPIPNDTTGGTLLGNKFETHRIVPSPPRQTIKSMTPSSRGSSSCAHVFPSPVSQCTAGSTHASTSFLASMSTTRGIISVVCTSFGFFTTSAFFGGEVQENCECGIPV
mmetsp:Transcript_10821/g.39198  ORF Transcript_10821/g.39198 Transcript_10821/m.39198 type:complete len:309 (-) Transcript_10821:1110-2036(-)